MTRTGAAGRTPEEQAFSQRVGQNIRDLREAAQLRQNELAQRMGVDQGTLALYEGGSTDMPTSRLHRIAEILDVAPHVLVGGSAKPEKGDITAYAIGPLRFLFSFEGNKIAMETSGSPAHLVLEDSGAEEQHGAIPRAA